MIQIIFYILKYIIFNFISFTLLLLNINKSNLISFLKKLYVSTYFLILSLIVLLLLQLPLDLILLIFYGKTLPKIIEVTFHLNSLVASFIVSFLYTILIIIFANILYKIPIISKLFLLDKVKEEIKKESFSNLIKKIVILIFILIILNLI